MKAGKIGDLGLVSGGNDRCGDWLGGRLQVTSTNPERCWRKSFFVQRWQQTRH